MEGAVKHFSYLWVASFVCAVTASGCGLVLDTQPRDNRADTGTGEQDGGQQDGDVPQCFIDDDCPDVNVCDGRETCVEGQCVGTDAIMNCADGIECTDDSCHPQLGCVFTPVDDRCTDDSICSPDMGCTTMYPCDTRDECGVQAACRGLLCVNNRCQRGEPLVCPDDGCLIGGCFNGGCVYVPDSRRCNSGSPGNCGVSTCEADGECSFPEPDPSLCNDDIECTDDICGGVTAFFCTHEPNHAFCDDGVACTYNFCSPDDPTAAEVIGSGCAMRLIDAVCAEQGGFEGCVSPVCLPSGCGDGVTVLPCDGGGICKVDSGECELPIDCDACADLSNPCVETTCDANQNVCLPSLDLCATTLPGFIGYCDTSNGDPHCAIRRNPQTLPPISIGLPAPVLP